MQKMLHCSKEQLLYMQVDPELGSWAGELELTWLVSYVLCGLHFRSLACTHSFIGGNAELGHVHSTTHNRPCLLGFYPSLSCPNMSLGKKSRKKKKSAVTSANSFGPRVSTCIWATLFEKAYGRNRFAMFILSVLSYVPLCTACNRQGVAMLLYAACVCDES